MIIFFRYYILIELAIFLQPPVFCVRDDGRVCRVDALPTAHQKDLPAMQKNPNQS